MENNTPIFITKSSGEKEAFSFQKLSKSLQRSGALPDEIEQIIETVKNTFYDGITSREIYKNAFQQLRKINSVYASKYSLKRAIAALGPTGYPFEKLIAALLKQEGYNVKISQIISGMCVNHEIDVLAQKDNDIYPIECKFHSKYNSVNNVRIPLYIQSRFIDIKNKWNSDSNKNTILKQAWIVTNTGFTLEAIKYASCVGIKLLGWNYPENESLNNNIDKYGLYPITTLITLTKAQKDRLLQEDIVLVKELIGNEKKLHKIGLKPQQVKKTLNEAKKLCSL
jgi:hypothetical protein